MKERGEALKKAKSGWYSLHMAAASHAIAQRIPLVDFILEVRDARIPLSSHCQLLSNFQPSSLRRIIVMNKTDLANRSQLKEWTKYFEQQNCISYGVNSHNKEDVKKVSFSVLHYMHFALLSLPLPLFFSPHYRVPDGCHNATLLRRITSRSSSISYKPKLEN